MSEFNFNEITDFKFIVFDGNKQLAGFNNSGDLIVYLSVLDKTNITISILYHKFYLMFDYEEFYRAFMVNDDCNSNSEANSDIKESEGDNDSSSD